MSFSTTPLIRHLTVAQGLSVAGSTVDLTLTGIVGARIAPDPGLATVPMSLIFLAAGVCTFGVSHAITRFGHRRVFVTVALAAATSGCVSALAIQTHQFWLFCVGTALIGAYQSGTAYYRYLAADTVPEARARAVTSVLAGGLVAAIVGPFLATWLRDLTSTPYVASYLLVAALGAAAALWNRRLPEPGARSDTQALAADDPRSEDAEPVAPRPVRELWRQPGLLVGVAVSLLAAVSMMTMMTAGPILGLAAGRTPTQAALAVQLHMIGMYAPGFLVARVMSRLGERTVAVLGCAVIAGAGIAAGMSTALPAFLISMCAAGVGWNLAYGGGSAMISASYGPHERGRVQPVAEVLILAGQVGGSVVAAAATTVHGWHVLGIVVVIAACGVAACLAASSRTVALRATA